MPKIEISDLSVDYKTSHGDIHALENIEFQLEDDESIGIAGESACGKSTLGLSIIRMLQGGNIISGKLRLGVNRYLICLKLNLMKVYVGRKSQ